MCGIVSISEYEDMARQPKGEYSYVEIVDRFTGPRNRKGLIVEQTDITPANFFDMGEPERISVSVWAIMSADGRKYEGFWGEDAIEQAQEYMAAQGFKRVAPAPAPTQPDLELTEADEEAVLQEISRPAVLV